MRKFAVLLTAGLCVAGGGGSRAEPEIGHVFQRPYLGATGMRVASGSENLYFNTTVYAGEAVITEGGGSTALKFHDGTGLQVGANSNVVLDRFVYDPDAGTADAVLNFSKGIFRFVSGELRDDSMRLETPSATLAIRGTAFILAVDDAGNTDVWIIAGAVEGTSRAGGAPGTAHAGQSLTVTNGVPGVLITDGRSGPHDPAVESGLGSLGRPGTDGRGDRSPHGSGESSGNGNGGGGNSGGGNSGGGNSGGSGNNNGGNGQ